MSRRWAVLVVGTGAQSSQAAILNGIAVLAPSLQERYHLGLGQLGVVIAANGLGQMVTLLAWGLAADRLGERITATIGLAGAAAGVTAAAFAPGLGTLCAALAVSGAFGAATTSATGRAVMGWFGPGQRGLALSIRQTSIPLAGLFAGLAVPPIVATSGTRAAFLVLAGISAAAAVAAALVLREGPAEGEPPPALEVVRHPLRDSRIWLLSAGSAVLVCTQMVMISFVVVFLENERGYTTAGAGAVLVAMNVIGAVGRLGSGHLSDRIGKRVTLIRSFALATAVGSAAVAALTSSSELLLLPVLALAGGLSMGWNALSFAAAAETAGRARSGAAVGLQQTTLAVSGALTPLAFAPLVAGTSWRVGFVAVAITPLIAFGLLRPLRDQPTARARA